MQRFREALLEAHPSLDTNTAFRSNRNTPSGADLVAQELDEFNERFQYLRDSLYMRLKEIADRCPGDIVTLVSRIIAKDFMSVDKNSLI